MKGTVLFVAHHRVEERGVLLLEVILETSLNERGHVFVIIINDKVSFFGILSYLGVISSILVPDSLVKHSNDLLGCLIDEVLGALCVHSTFLAGQLPLVLSKDLSCFCQSLVDMICCRLSCDQMWLFRQQASPLGTIADLAAGSLLVVLVMCGVL